MSMPDFCRRLKEARASAGLTQEALGRMVGAAGTTIGRWEKGHIPLTRDVAVALDKAVGGRGGLVRAWQVARNGSVLADWQRSEPELDRAARVVELLSPNYVSGLLQCSAYIRHVLREGVYPGDDDDVRREVARKSRRYPALRKSSNALVVGVFPVVALLGVPADVRRAQAAHLVKLVDSGRVLVHLLPENTLAGVVAPLTVYHLQDGGTVAIGDSVNGMLIYDSPADQPLMAERMKRAMGRALPPDQSRTIMEGMTE